MELGKMIFLTGPEQNWMDWDRMGWIETEWDGLRRNGMDWDGIGCIETEWDGSVGITLRMTRPGAVSSPRKLWTTAGQTSDRKAWLSCNFAFNKVSSSFYYVTWYRTSSPTWAKTVLYIFLQNFICTGTVFFQGNWCKIFLYERFFI